MNFSGKRREARGRGDGGSAAGRATSPAASAGARTSCSALLVCGALGLAWRAVELQLKDHEFLAGQGDARFSRVAEITATRGTITDRYGEPLAVSTPVDSVWVNPKELALASDQLPRLAKALKRDKNEIARRLTSNLDREFLYLVRHMQPAEAQKIRALEIPGVYLMREYRRYYPAGEVAGHILGFTSVDDEGQEGLELAFDHWLAGEDGAKRVIQDRYGKIVQNVEEIRAMRPGRNLVLSIDLRIQYLAYRELKAAIRDQRAKSGRVIVLDVATGEVLAMVNQPTYNPNDRDQIKAKAYPQSRGHRHRRARLVDQAVRRGRGTRLGQVLRPQRHRHQPGLHQGRRQTTRGSAQPRRGQPRDHPREELERRHDQGRAVARARADVRHARGARLRPGDHQSGYPGESAGLLPHFSHWRPVGISSMSRGYGLSITPLQLAHAYATVASYGVARPISFLRVESPPEGERALDESVSRMLIHLLEVGGRAGGRRQTGRDSGLHRGRQDRHRLEGDRRWLCDGPLPGGLWRRRAGERAAPRGGRDHR